MRERENFEVKFTFNFSASAGFESNWRIRLALLYTVHANDTPPSTVKIRSKFNRRDNWAVIKSFNFAGKMRNALALGPRSLQLSTN